MLNKVITWKLVLSTLAVLLPIWLLSSLGYVQLAKSHHKQLTELLHSVLATTQHSLLSWKEQQFHALELLSSDRELAFLATQLARSPLQANALREHPNQEKINTRLRPLLNAHQYLGYFLVTPGNINIAASESASIGQGSELPARSQQLQQAWAGHFFVRTPHADEYTGTALQRPQAASSPVVLIGTPIRDTTGSITAVLVLKLNPEQHFNSLFQYADAKAAHAHPLTEGLTITSLPINQAWSASTSPQNGTLSSLYASLLTHNEPKRSIQTQLQPYQSWHPQPVIGASLNIPEMGLTLITELDASHAFHGLTLAQRILLGGTVLISFILIALTLTFQVIKQRINHRKQELSRLFEQASDPMLLVDPYSQKIISGNHKACALLGYTRKEFRQLHLKTIKEEAFPGELENNLKQLIKQGSAVFESRYCHRNGTQFPVEVSCQITQFNDLPTLLISIRDISEHKALEAQLKAQAQTDQLTQLPNRIAFDEQLPSLLKTHLRSQAPLALIFIGLDDFSIINDTLGHNIGDQVFIKTAQRITETIPSGGQLYRFEGDVFVCALPVKNAANADQIAGNMTRAFTHPISVHGHLLHLAVSLGVALAPKDAKKLLDLTRCAHSAMHAAKDLGGNRWVLFTDKMQANYQRHMDLKNALSSALKRNELSLNYQPIVDAHTGKIVGAESLLRWTHPELGPIGPDQFIPIAEKSGHIIAIGDWIIDEACQTLAMLRTHGLTDLRLSVNLSPVQLLAADILQTTKNTLDFHGLPANALAIEITEGLFIEDYSTAQERIIALHDYNIPLYMDDFGTGYSSLSYLSRLPFHTLKLDRSFVTHLEQRSRDRKLASSIISMSEKLGLRVIAEGVETTWQKEFLENNGCHFFQGYLFYKPMSKDDLLNELLRRKHPMLSAVPNSVA